MPGQLIVFRYLAPTVRQPFRQAKGCRCQGPYLPFIEPRERGRARALHPRADFSRFGRFLDFYPALFNVSSFRDLRSAE